MKNKKMVLWFALIVMAIIPVYAQQYNPESDFKIDWDKDIKDGVVITGYIGTRREVSIPPKIQNNPVTRIESAFENNKNITKVTIPNSVTNIEWGAFAGCTNLTSITIPNSVTNISGAFSGCTSLTSITIPNSVTTIGNNAFSGCTSLTSITIPNSVTTIGNNAFSDCTSLTSITIPNSVTSIKDLAFSNCKRPTSITIPDSVTEIGYAAFSGCTSLTSVTFQGKIDSNKFYYHSYYSVFPGDLRDKYLASDGGPGTYKRFAGGETWKKQ